MSVLTEEKKIPLVLLRENGEQIEGKTKFQKLVYLAQQEEGLDDHFEFQKYNYGPYSFELTETLETLEDLDMISVSKKTFSTEGRFKGKKFIYSLTEKGKKQLDGVNKDVKQPLSSSSEEWGDKSLDDVLTYVYDKYM
jgi:uncharacterized protein YwgA